MRSLAKTAAQKLLGTLGIQVTRRAETQAKRFPVEFDDADRAIVDYVTTHRLSMAATERLFATLLACRHVCESGIEGNFVECGVWRGGNSIIAADVFRRLAPDRKVYLFDTFGGMTAPTDRDVNIHGRTAASKFQALRREDHNEWCYASIEDVRASFQALGLLEHAIFVEGDVCETLGVDEHLPAHVSVLRLDTDWYESTRKELEVLYPRLSVGGVLLLDDYGHWVGAREATDEYFAQHGRPFLQYNGYAGRVAVKYR